MRRLAEVELSDAERSVRKRLAQIVSSAANRLANVQIAGMLGFAIGPPISSAPLPLASRPPTAIPSRSDGLRPPTCAAMVNVRRICKA